MLLIITNLHHLPRIRQYNSKGYDLIVIDGSRDTELAPSAIMTADVVIIPVQPNAYDIWTAEEVVKLIEEAIVYKFNLKSVFVVNREIANTAISRYVVEALSGYSVPTLTASIVTHRVVFAEADAQGLVVHEIDNASPATVEIEAIRKELMEFIQ